MASMNVSRIVLLVIAVEWRLFPSFSTSIRVDSVLVVLYMLWMCICVREYPLYTRYRAIAEPKRKIDSEE